MWTTAALMGQAAMNQEESQRAAACLDLSPEVAEALRQFPMKGSLDATMKALIHEMFGDGIMSAIDSPWISKRWPIRMATG
jgi:cyanate lyase